MKVTKIFEFAAGHRLSGYNGKCFYPHGHNFKLKVTVTGQLDELGMIIDFSILKVIVERILDENFDHKMILKKDDPINQAIVEAFFKDRPISKRLNDAFYLVDYNPTAENMGLDLFNKIKDASPEVILSKITLYETDTSYAEITK